MTRGLHHRVDEAGARPAVTPIYQVSAFGAGSPFFYSRKSNPNVVEFEDVVKGLEGAAHGVAVASGMAAIRLCLEQLRPGDAVVTNALIYGCSFKLLQRFCRQYDVTLQVRDLCAPDDVDVPRHTKLVFFETPTNPFLKTVDIARIAAASRASAPSAMIVVDNTWATPLFQHPLDLGADVSLHSATKYMSGHSDVMGGILLTNREDLAEAFRQERFYSGPVLDPHAAWLLRRSLQTLEIRVERQARTTAEMRGLLASLPQVQRVFYPEIDGRQLRGYGGILFIELRPDLVGRYGDLVTALDGAFGNGTAMAGVTSMIAQPDTGSHASMTRAEKDAIGLSPALVRLCFGLEDAGDLQASLARALASIDAKTAGQPAAIAAMGERS